MANIVIDSKFNPFSYSELLAPVQAADTEHKNLEEQLASLSAQSAAWQNMADEQTDKESYMKIKEYSDMLRDQADTLIKEGLNPQSRNSLMNAKVRYASDIVPIEKAFERRRSLADEQRKLLAQDNSLLLSRDATSLSLDDLVRNPELSYQMYSGNELTRQVGTAAANLARDMRGNPDKWRNILGGQYYEVIRSTGFRPQEVMRVLSSTEDGSTILRGIMDDAIESSGIRGWADDNMVNRAYEYAGRGLWQAVGQSQPQTLRNVGYGKGGGGSTELPYSIVTRASVRDTETSKLGRDRSIIEEVMRDPSLIESKTPGSFSAEDYVTSNIPLGYGEEAIAAMRGEAAIAGNKVGNTYREVVDRYKKKYGIEGDDISVLGNIVNNMNREIASSAQLHDIGFVNMTDNKVAGIYLKNSASAFVPTGGDGEVPVYPIRDNGTSPSPPVGTNADALFFR